MDLNSQFEKPETTGWERKSLRQVDFLAAITPVVAKVEPGSVAAEAGLKPNDQIVAVDGAENLLSAANHRVGPAASRANDSADGAKG